jgi:hypothetical protein
MRLLFVIALALLSARADAQTNAASGSGVQPMAVIYKSPLVHDLGSLRVVVHDAEEFERYWDRITAQSSNPPRRPDIDFTKYQVIIASLGFRGSPTSSIAVTEVKYKNDILDVSTELRFRGENCGPAPAEAQSPTVIVRVPATGGIAVFHDRAIVTHC